MKNTYDNKDFFDEYKKMSRSQEGLKAAGEWHQLKHLIPDLKNKTVLDLGCGFGWHCKYAVKQGAKYVLGIDASENMIAQAKIRNFDPNIEYIVSDLMNYNYPEAAFDCVISNLVLHYIEDIDAIFSKVYKTLIKEGTFILNIEHPVFTGSVNQEWIVDENNVPLYWPVDNYFYPGIRKTQFLGKEVMKYHHTLTQILRGLLESNFTITAVEEAMPAKEMLDIPGMMDEMRRPMMLMVKVTK